ncbi:MAG: transporter [Nitrospirota bacterium]
MNGTVRTAVLLIGLMMSPLAAGRAFAGHPLITDDTGTQGKGKTQLEFIGEYGIEKENGITEKGLEVPTTPFLSYGLSDTMDLVFGLPYVSVRVEDAGTTTAVRGATDMSIELKARVYEKDGWSFAVKPGVSLPTGNEEKGLGNGKTSYSAFLIATKKVEPWAFHMNVGYMRNEYKLQADENANRQDIWHVSIASQVEVARNFNVVANIGIERNPDRTSNTDPAFALAGFIYSIADNLDIDLGIKKALNKPETDTTVLAGITWRL